MSPEKTGTKQKGDRSAEPQFISMETAILLKMILKQIIMKKFSQIKENLKNQMNVSSEIKSMSLSYKVKH